jgi:hypothetical protein
MRLSLKFDPYSPTAADDYEVMRAELEKVNILMLLKSELSKSRIHISLTKKIISAIRYIDESKRDEMVVTLIKNADLLYPVYSNVLFVSKSVFNDLDVEGRNSVIEFVKSLIRAKSYIVQVPLNLAYAVRLISCESSADNEELLNNVYSETKDIGIRRDIILAMSRWESWEWISNLRNTFRTLSPPERRAFIVASYRLRDEGKHWRQHIQNELSPLEKLIQTWSSEKIKIGEWRVPL